MISVYLTTDSIRVVVLDLKRNNYCLQLQVMSGVVALMYPNLPQRTRNKPASLNQNSIWTNVGCVTIDCEVLSLNSNSKYMNCQQHIDLLRSHLTPLRTLKINIKASLLGQNYNNGKEALHKPSIVTHQTNKAPKLNN